MPSISGRFFQPSGRKNHFCQDAIFQLSHAIGFEARPVLVCGCEPLCYNSRSNCILGKMRLCPGARHGDRSGASQSHFQIRSLFATAIRGNLCAHSSRRCARLLVDPGFDRKRLRAGDGPVRYVRRWRSERDLGSRESMVWIRRIRRPGRLSPGAHHALHASPYQSLLRCPATRGVAPRCEE